MDELYQIDIDLTRLQASLAASGTPWSLEAVESWLREVGFVRTPDGWLSDEGSLLALHETEYRIVRRL